MNVLEKILKEILQYRKDNNLYAGKQVLEIENIIRSHMDEVKGTKVSGNNGWIPVGERLPENNDCILLSFENYSIPDIGRYEQDEEGGAFYPGDGDYTYLSYGLFVNAWKPLPKPYKGERL